MRLLDRQSLTTQVVAGIAVAAILALVTWLWPPARAWFLSANRVVLVAGAAAIGAMVGWWARARYAERLSARQQPLPLYKTGPADYPSPRELEEPELEILQELAKKNSGEPSATSDFVPATGATEQRVLFYLERLEREGLVYQRLIRGPRRWFLTAEGRAHLAARNLL